MREIKFRSYDSYSCEFDKLNLTSDFNDHDYYLLLQGGAANIEQYTGLKDKNGVEIYEGDILLLKGKEEYSKPVVFYRGTFGVKGVTGNVCALSSLASFNRKFEVIGNIHQHPHLLEI